MKPLPINSDLDVLRFDVDPVDKRHENGSDCVRGKRRKFLGDLTPARDQSPLLNSILLRVRDSTEHGSFIGEEGAEPPK